MANRGDISTRWLPKDAQGRIRIDASGSLPDPEVMDNDQLSRGVPRGSDGAIVVSLPSVASTSDLVTRPVAPALPLAGMRVYGQSFADAGYDVAANAASSGIGPATDGIGFPDLLALNLGIDITDAAKFDNQAVGGTALQDPVAGWGKVMQQLNGTKVPAPINLLVHGVNDLAIYGPSLTGFEHALRASIARLRAKAGGVHEESESTFSGTTAGSVVAGTKNSGAGFYRAVSTDGYLQVYPTSAYKGGPMTAQFLAFPGTGAAVLENFNSEFGADAAFDTRGVCPTSPSGTVIPVVRRFEGTQGGVGNYWKWQAKTLATSWEFDCWSEEAPTPPLVVLMEHPRTPIYPAIGGGYQMTEVDLNRVNALMRRVAGEFRDGRVICVPAPDLLHPGLMESDLVHPNRRGAKVLADAAYEAIVNFGRGPGLTADREHFVGAAGERPFGAKFSNYGGNFQTLRYWKDRDNTVHIAGVVGNAGSAAASGDVIVNLPAGYRPDAFYFASQAWYVTPDGDVVWNGGSVAAGGALAQVYATYRTAP